MKLRLLLLSAMCLTAVLPATVAAQTINTAAGNGGSGTTGDGGLATAAEVGYPVGVLAAPDGGFYIGGYNSVRRVRADGTIHTFVGDGTFGSSGDGGPATAAKIGGNIGGLALGPDGNLYIADWGGNRIRKVDAHGIINTVALVDFPNSLAFDSSGNLYIGGSCKVSRLSTGGVLTVIAGSNTCGTSGGDGGPAANASFVGNIYGIAVDTSGNIWISDTDAKRLRKIGPDNTISTAVSGLVMPMGMSADSAGNVYFVDRGAQAVSRVSAAGVVSIFAGIQWSGGGFSGDGGPATEAKINQPWGINVGAGQLLIADSFNHRIRKVTADIAPVPLIPSTSCASEGYTGTKLTWCKNICESEYTGSTLSMWMRRWIDRYHDEPYCMAEDN